MTTPTTTQPVMLPANFPSLIPSYTFSFRIGGPTSPVGALSRGQPLTVVHIVRGTVSTEPPAPQTSSSSTPSGGAASAAGTAGAAGASNTRTDGVVRLEATVRGMGIDYVRNDPDGGRMRLDAGVVVE